jgi:hypothetical protein
MADLFLHAAVLDETVSRVHAIVIGSVETRVEMDQNVLFDLSVMRVIKDEGIPSRLHVSHTWKRKVTISPTDLPIVDFQIHGAWLLKKTTGDHWDVLVVNGPDGLMPSLCLPAVEQLAPHSRAHPRRYCNPERDYGGRDECVAFDDDRCQRQLLILSAGSGNVYGDAIACRVHVQPGIADLFKCKHQLDCKFDGRVQWWEHSCARPE